jgi:hypothetical protein
MIDFDERVVDIEAPFWMGLSLPIGALSFLSRESMKLFYSTI